MNILYLSDFDLPWDPYVTHFTNDSFFQKKMLQTIFETGRDPGKPFTINPGFVMVHMKFMEHLNTNTIHNTRHFACIVLYGTQPNSGWHIYVVDVSGSLVYSLLNIRLILILPGQPVFELKLWLPTA